MYTGMYQIQQLERKSLYHSRVFSTPDRRTTDEVIRATATTQRPPSAAGSEFVRCKFKFFRGVSEFSRAE